MIVLDTHAWIWWAGDPKKLSAIARRRVADAPELAIAAIAAPSCWEVAMLVEKGHLALDRDVLDWIRQALALPKVNLVPLSSDIAVAAARLEGTFPGDPADRMIVATTLDLRATLITKDRRIRSLRSVPTAW